jgi:hypothetical protein
MVSKYICSKCDYKCGDISNWEKHTKTKKHTSDNTNQLIFECISCNYTCYAQSIMDKHKKTKKHNSKILNNDATIIHELKQPVDSELMVIIKSLLSQNSELKNFIIEQAAEHKKETVEIVNKVIDQAAEHKKETTDIITKVIEQTKTINNNTITNNNKAFNINMYLNEQCKDAMNFSDFINGIEVSHEDLENNAQLGFVGGISKILIDNLKLMNKNERPIHCTDAKRETMYIKDDNKWSKEEDDSKLRSAIQEITRKSICSLIGWKRGNPESDDMDSEFSSRCIVIQQQSMAGFNREVYYPKVIHAIAREVLILK